MSFKYLSVNYDTTSHLARRLGCRCCSWARWLLPWRASRRLPERVSLCSWSVGRSAAGGGDHAQKTQVSSVPGSSLFCLYVDTEPVTHTPVWDVAYCLTWNEDLSVTPRQAIKLHSTLLSHSPVWDVACWLTWNEDLSVCQTKGCKTVVVVNILVSSWANVEFYSRTSLMLINQLLTLRDRCKYAVIEIFFIKKAKFIIIIIRNVLLRVTLCVTSCRGTLCNVRGIAGVGSVVWVRSLVNEARMVSEWLQFSSEGD